jgi:hypothetical protein
LAAVIDEKLVSISPESLAEEVGSYKIHKKGIRFFTLNLTVTKHKTKPNLLQKNVLIEVKSDSTRRLVDEWAYDNFLDYLRYAYEKYVAPIYVDLCKIGDIVQVYGEIDEEGFFVNDECNVAVIICIPNDSKENWAVYLEKRYRELFKFRNFLEKMDFEVRDYKFQKVAFHYKFKMEASQTYNAIKESNQIDEDHVGIWYALAEEVVLKSKTENYHTHSIVATKRVETEFGPRLELAGIETTKSRIE